MKSCFGWSRPTAVDEKPASVARAENFRLKHLGITIDESPLGADWKQRLANFTDERHQIVHRGSDTVIRRAEAKECTDLIEAIGTAINRGAVKYYHR
jgi:hypothetical protein